MLIYDYIFLLFLSSQIFVKFLYITEDSKSVLKFVPINDISGTEVVCESRFIVTVFITVHDQ